MAPVKNILRQWLLEHLLVEKKNLKGLSPYLYNDYIYDIRNLKGDAIKNVDFSKYFYTYLIFTIRVYGFNFLKKFEKEVNKLDPKNRLFLFKGEYRGDLGGQLYDELSTLIETLKKSNIKISDYDSSGVVKQAISRINELDTDDCIEDYLGDFNSEMINGSKTNFQDAGDAIIDAASCIIGNLESHISVVNRRDYLNDTFSTDYATDIEDFNVDDGELVNTKYKPTVDVYLSNTFNIAKEQLVKYNKSYIDKITYIMGESKSIEIIKKINNLTDTYINISFVTPKTKAKDVHPDLLNSYAEVILSDDLPWNYGDDDDDDYYNKKENDITLNISFEDFTKTKVLYSLETKIRDYEKQKTDKVKSDFEQKINLPNIKKILSKFNMNSKYNIQILFGNKPSMVKQIYIHDFINQTPIETLKQVVDMRVTNKPETIN